MMIRLRWGFVIVSVLYAVYQYLGIKALMVAIAVCGGLVAIGYSEAEKEEEEWNVHLDKLNSIMNLSQKERSKITEQARSKKAKKLSACRSYLTTSRLKF